MKFLRYTAALTAALGISLLVAGCGNGADKQAQKYEEDVKAHYGDSVTDINVSSVVSPLDGETKIYTITATAADGTEFTIDTENIALNSYLRNYFEGYMEDKATELLTDNFKGNEFTVDATIQADDTEFIPGGELMGYMDYMKEYAELVAMRPRLNIKAELPHTSFTNSEFYRVAEELAKCEEILVTVVDVDFNDNFTYMTYPYTLPANIFTFTPEIIEKTQAQAEALDSIADYKG